MSVDKKRASPSCVQFINFQANDCSPINFCNAKDSIGNQALCGVAKWYCHDPQAIAIFDIGAECESDAWGTVGCCYAGDGGAACDHDELVADVSDIFNAW